MLYFEIIKYGVSNSRGMPEEWIKKTYDRGAFGSSPAAVYGGIVLSEDELAEHIADNQDAYDLWRETSIILPKNKELRRQEVFKRSMSLLTSGFSYDGYQFSLNPDANDNLNGIDNELSQNQILNNLFRVIEPNLTDDKIKRFRDLIRFRAVVTQGQPPPPVQ